MRRWAAVLLVVSLLAACEGGQRSAESSVTHWVTEAPSPAPSSAPVELDPVVLTASLAERPAAWRLVTEIPFGSREAQLGYVPEASDAYVGGVPPSFAVDRDGSVWILDYVKGRVAHYAATGDYLGSLGRFPVGGVWRVRDLQVRDGSLVVLRGNILTAASAVTVFDGGDQRPMKEVTLGDEPAILYSLVPGTPTLTGELHGFGSTADHPAGSGPSGWVEVNPDLGSVRERAGVPLSGGNNMDIASPLDVHLRSLPDRLEVTFLADDGSSVLPLRFRLVRRVGSPVLRHSVAVWVQGARPHGLSASVRIVTSGRDEDLTLGGWWYLEVSDDGSALVWERLPDPGIPTEAQVRYLTTAPDGSVYLMLLGPRGARIYRR